MAGFALSVVVGVLFASLSTLLAGFGALFGDGSQQGGILGGEVVGRIAQGQHLVNGFGAGFHGFVAGSKLVDAVVEADAASSQAGSGSFEQAFVNFAGGSSGAVGMSVSVLFGSGGRGGREGEGGGSGADECSAFHVVLRNDVEISSPFLGRRSITASPGFSQFYSSKCKYRQQLTFFPRLPKVLAAFL